MEDVQYIADTLEKPMRRINATRQTDLEQLEIVSLLLFIYDAKLILRLSRLP
jgi:hypothetical protein